jgi:hypothetical protein
MNFIHEVMELPVNEEPLRFGLSSLHAWIRCFECLLYISYRLGINTWQVRGQENKDNFCDKIGLLSISQKVAAAELQTMETQPEGFLPLPPNQHQLLGYLKTLLFADDLRSYIFLEE